MGLSKNFQVGGHTKICSKEPNQQESCAKLVYYVVELSANFGAYLKMHIP